MSPIIEMVGFTATWGWVGAFLTTRSTSRLRGLIMVFMQYYRF